MSAWWCHQRGPLDAKVRTKPTQRTCLQTLYLFTSQQHNGSYQPPATPQPVPEAGPASNACSSEENQNQQPPQAATQPQPHGASQEAGGYMLTPNAPALYGPSYSPFEKPPPYACWAAGCTLKLQTRPRWLLEGKHPASGFHVLA